MTQHNLAFITGHGYATEPLDAILLTQAERYVAAGRRNLVIVMDTFPSFDPATLGALQKLLRRASELRAQVTCVALDDHVMSALRGVPLAESLRIIRRVDELPGVA
jgi:anti-anti-sigma regulatory factor